MILESKSAEVKKAFEWMNYKFMWFFDYYYMFVWCGDQFWVALFQHKHLIVSSSHTVIIQLADTP